MRRSLSRLVSITWAWTAVTLVGVLSTCLRMRSGEVHPAPGWYWSSIVSLPVWIALTPPILAISRRAPIERRRWARAAAAHGVALAIVLALDGVVSLALDHVQGGALGYWQALWRFSFIDVFFYAGVVVVEHAARYYRLSIDRHVRASELEAQLARSQLQALQMQIRPHFLFNALNTIAGLVRTGEHDAAVTMLAGLGELLRVLLRSDGAQVVPVCRELDLIERYLRVEQVRFGDQLRIDVTVQPGTEDALVPNLILQPLVENAVRHGIASAPTGRVAVEISRVGPSLRMAVTDSGDLGDAVDLGDGHGLGLHNTRARLERLYGDAHRFDLARTADGTRAVIEIPLVRAEASPSAEVRS